MIAIVLTMLKMLPVGDKVPPQALAIVPTAGTKLPQRMRARLAVGVSMAVPFDTYLVDEVTSVGDAAFRKKSDAVFLSRMRASGAVVVSHSMETMRLLCTMGAVLENGELRVFDNIEHAIRHHLVNMQV